MAAGELRDREKLENVFGNLGFALARTIEVAICGASPASQERCTAAWNDVGGAIHDFMDDTEEVEEEDDD